MFKVAIIGGEGRGDYRLFATKCAFFLKNKVKEGITILTTGDEYVEFLSQKANIDIKKYFVNWSEDGKDALKNRVLRMVEDCDALIIFEDGTTETKMFKHYGEKNNKPIRFVKL